MIYLICFFLSSLTLSLSVKRQSEWVRSILFVISIAILVILATIRSPEVGIDVRVYVAPYCKIALNSISFLSYLAYILSIGVEPGYAILNYVGAKLGGGLSGVFALIAIFSILPVYARLYEIREKAPVFVSSMLYMLLFYNLSLNLSRQAIALAIVFWGTKYLDKNKFKFCICVILAMLFHNSAIIGGMILIIACTIKGTLTHLKKVIVFIGVLIGIVFYNPILSFILSNVFSNAEKYLNAFLESETGYLSIWNILFKLLNSVLVIVGYKYLKSKVENYIFFIMIIIFDFMLYFLNAYNGNCFRYGLYFTIFIPMILTSLRNAFEESGKVFFDIFLLMIYIFYWYNFNIISDSYGTLPYCIYQY